MLEWLASGVQPITPEAVPQPWWEIGLVILGAFSAVCGFLVIVWKIARPHIKTYVESVVKPLQDKANATHEQVTKNGHTSVTPTMLDRIDRLSGDVSDILRVQHRNTRKIDMLGQSLDDHKTESAKVLAEAVTQFSQQGITLHLDEPPRYGDD